nr:DUF4097 family beta strand repeat-containing protein [Bacillus sp. 1NLA3E]
MDLFNLGGQDHQGVISDNINQIDIDVSSVSTNIIPENRNNIKADLNGKGKVIINRNGNKITVSAKVNWFDWFNFSNKAKLNIYIPEDYHRNMRINLGSGNLTFSGHSQNKPMKLDELSLDIGSGNVELKNLEVNQLIHDEASGNVAVSSLTTKSGSFDISSGSLDIKHYSGAIDAQLSSGRLDLQIDKLKDSVDIEVSSGQVQLDLPNQADFTLNGKASSGTISCDFPLNSKEINTKTINGKHGSGKNKINLTVSSGSIKIY